MFNGAKLGKSFVSKYTMSLMSKIRNVAAAGSVYNLMFKAKSLTNREIRGMMETIRVGENSLNLIVKDVSVTVPTDLFTSNNGIVKNVSEWINNNFSQLNLNNRDLLKL